MALTVLVIGCEHSQGLSKKDNRPYNFANVNYLKPNSGWSNDKGQCQAVGYEAASIGMNPNPALVEVFRTMQEQFPCMAELSLEPDPENPQRNQVVDIKVV